MNDEMFRLALIDITNDDLLNDFVNDIFGYDFAILGPVSTILANMQNNATGSGMGSAGLVGQITTYQTMITYDDPKLVIIKIILLHFVLPAVITLFFSEVFRKANLIKSGDMALNL